MADFNMVNVQSQGQVGKTVDDTNFNILKRDVKDYQEILPILKSLQQGTSKILKDYHEYQEKKDRKHAGLPYHLIKKFQGVRSTLMKAQDILTYQCRFYQYSVGNREYEKNEEQYFFRKTMKSYDQRRLWMKAYILRMEGQVQVVEQEVKKNVEYETHKYSQFLNDLNVERLEHNYEDKLEALGATLAAARKNIELRGKIQAKLQLIRKINEQKIAISQQTQQVQGQQQEKMEESKSETNKVNPSKTIPKPTKNAKMSSQPPNLSILFYNYLTKQFIRKEFIQKELKFLVNQKKIYSYKNQQLKVAIDLIQQRKEANNMQYKIICQSQLPDEVNQQTKKVKVGQKLTKTDFFIYLKELHRSVQQLMKRYGLSFHYILMDRAVMKNHGKSRSAQKRYKMKKPSLEAERYTQSCRIKELQKYREDNLKDILQRREWQKANNQMKFEQEKNEEINKIAMINQDKPEKMEVKQPQKINEKEILPTSEYILQQNIAQNHQKTTENKQEQIETRQQQPILSKPFPKLPVQIEQQQFNQI